MNYIIMFEVGDDFYKDHPIELVKEFLDKLNQNDNVDEISITMNEDIN